MTLDGPMIGEVLNVGDNPNALTTLPAPLPYVASWLGTNIPFLP
jgi:hypothetical protein